MGKAMMDRCIDDKVRVRLRVVVTFLCDHIPLRMSTI
jgi:hypothetical protein